MIGCKICNKRLTYLVSQVHSGCYKESSDVKSTVQRHCVNIWHSIDPVAGCFIFSSFVHRAKFWRRHWSSMMFDFLDLRPLHQSYCPACAEYPVLVLPVDLLCRWKASHVVSSRQVAVCGQAESVRASVATRSGDNVRTGAHASSRRRPTNACVQHGLYQYRQRRI